MRLGDTYGWRWTKGRYGSLQGKPERSIDLVVLQDCSLSALRRCEKLKKSQEEGVFLWCLHPIVHHLLPLCCSDIWHQAGVNKENA